MESNKSKEERLILRKIKLLLFQRNKQFQQLAEYVGMTPQGLRLSLKRNKTSFETIKMIADFLQVSPHYLTDDSKIESKPVYRSADAVARELQGSNAPGDLIEMLERVNVQLSMWRPLFEKILRHYVKKYPDDPMSELIKENLGFLALIKKEDIQELNSEVDRIIAQ